MSHPGITSRVPVDPSSPAADVVSMATRILESGGIVSLPYETVYGLSVDPRIRDAVERLRILKGRGETKGFILVFRDEEHLRGWVRIENHYTETLMECLWPGPLTLVLRAGSGIPSWICAKGNVAVRPAATPLVRALATGLGGPIVSTSANVSGQPEPCSAGRVMRLFGARIDLLLDGGRTAGPRPSTVVDCTGERPRILRPGKIPAATILDLSHI